MLLVREALLEALYHQINPCELLPEVIVQIETDAPALVLSDLQQLVFQSLALFNYVLEL